MGRIRVVVAMVAALVGVTAIALGVRIATDENARLLTTDTTVIPEAKAPRASDRAGEPVTTETTFDLAVLAPATTKVPPPVLATPTTARPSTTVAAPGKGTAIVRVDNTSTVPVLVTLADDSEHKAVVPAGDGVTWIVRTSNAKADRGDVRVNGTTCGVAWSKADNIVGGREYHLEVKSSAGFCAGGQPMPMFALTDYTAGASKTIAGLVPDAHHALIYIVNTYAAPTRVTVDAVETVEWTMDPSVWGATMRLATSVNDTADDVARVALKDDASCANRDDATHFVGGHTYRIEVVAGSVRCSKGTGPALAIYDLTAQTSIVLD